MSAHRAPRTAHHGQQATVEQFAAHGRAEAHGRAAGLSGRAAVLPSIDGHHPIAARASSKQPVEERARARRSPTPSWGIVVARSGGGALVYGARKLAIGLRHDPEQEFDGADLSVHRISATPERQTGI